jgi:predicted HAD superfamily Cof-like phosphohydrolase
LFNNDIVIVSINKTYHMSKLSELMFNNLRHPSIDPDYFKELIDAVVEAAELNPDYQADIKAFHEKFGLIGNEKPGFLSPELAEFRKKFLQEEVDEFNEAVDQGDIVKAAHELCDVLYIAFGTAYQMGIPIGKVWDEVQRANMSKVRATSSDQSKRGSTLDVVKPPGWKRADVKSVIDKEFV